MSDYYSTNVAALPLFEHLARKTDPATSHAAGARARVFRGEHHAKILDALAGGPAGQTEIAARTGLTVAQVSKRLGELRRGGDIERCGEARSGSGGREAAYRRCGA